MSKNNPGDYNSGYYNSGDYNSGDYNSGGCNSGDYNSGDHNSGDCNSGDRNSGHCNSGHYNSGSYNSGNYNSGNYNSGNGWNGSFNIGKHSEVYLFNKLVNIDIYNEYMGLFPELQIQTWVEKENMSITQKNDNPDYKVTGGILVTLSDKEAWQLSWDSLSDNDKKTILKHPLTNIEILTQITGIDLLAECFEIEILKND